MRLTDYIKRLPLIWSRLLKVEVLANTTMDSFTGWAEYKDTQYTSASPFTVTAGSKVTLPNNAGAVIDSQKPSDIPYFYIDSGLNKITGRNGDGITVMMEFKARPTSVASDVRLKHTVDIGGGIGEIYPRDFPITKGNGVEHYIMSSFTGFTLNTWEANGGVIKIEAFNSNIEIYDIRYVITRTHKAR